MSDDLVKRLRWKAGAYAKEAADRIEELEAKLEKAIEALEKISDTDPDSGTEWFHTFAHAAFAELRGKTDD